LSRSGIHGLAEVLLPRWCRFWCQAAFAQEPEESAIAAITQQRGPVNHVIAPLEAAHHRVAAGADIIGVGDAVCSQMSPRMYR
jgi:hypothetical protein